MDANRKQSRNKYKAIRMLEATGYSCAWPAGSLGIFDIVAISHKGIRLIKQIAANKKRDATDPLPHPMNTNGFL
jgi:hypothetical protein